MSMQDGKVPAALYRYIEQETSFLMEQYSSQYAKKQESQQHRNLAEASISLPCPEISTAARSAAERNADILSIYLYYRQESVKILSQQLEKLQSENSQLFSKYQDAQRSIYTLVYDLQYLRGQMAQAAGQQAEMESLRQVREENAYLREKASLVLKIVEYQQLELDQRQGDIQKDLIISYNRGQIYRLYEENALLMDSLDSLGLASRKSEILYRERLVCELQARVAALEHELADSVSRAADQARHLREEFYVELEGVVARREAELRNDFYRTSQDACEREDKHRYDIEELQKRLNEEKSSHQRDIRVYETTRQYLLSAQQELAESQRKQTVAVTNAKKRYDRLADDMERLLKDRDSRTYEILEKEGYIQRLKAEAASYTAEIESLKRTNTRLKCGSFGVLHYDGEITRILDGIQEESRREVQRILCEVERTAMTRSERKEDSDPVSYLAADSNEAFSEEKPEEAQLY